MVIIVDDTFIDRHKFHDIDYLKESKYQTVCKIYTYVKTTEIAQITKDLSDCKIFCNHKTLQLYNIEGRALKNEDNTKNREALLNKITIKTIQRIEFSRGLETNFETNRIDKDLFYTNLKAFLDYYIENNVIVPKILFWGQNFMERERLTIIQNMLMQIRMVNIEEFKNNSVIKEGINILYPEQNFNKIIESWVNLSKNDIIQQINNQIF